MGATRHTKTVPTEASMSVQKPSMQDCASHNVLGHALKDKADEEYVAHHWETMHEYAR